VLKKKKKEKKKEREMQFPQYFHNKS